MAIDKDRKRSKQGKTRDGNSFALLPWVVLDSLSYKSLSHTARGLLIEFARQYVRDNNGRLLASMNYLKKRGWNSSAVVTRAKRELIEAGFIFETVKGCRPNKASWYAITWQDLDKNPKYDSGTMEAWKSIRSSYAKNEVLKPPSGTKHKPIVPCAGVVTPPAIPSGGIVMTPNDSKPIPSGGDHLEIPSAFEIKYH